MDFSEFSVLENKLSTRLDEERFRHTIGVAYTAACMAMRYGLEINMAYEAGLLHDCAKQYKTNEQCELAKKFGIGLSDSETKCPQLIHAKTGAYMAEHEYGVEDKEILNAILTHTTGEPQMSLLQKIIYIADYIEPNRDKQPRLPQIRQTAFEDIDAAMLMILEDTVNYLKKKQFVMDEKTLETYEYYLKEKQ